MQRIRDPLHNLIEFDESQVEHTAWKIIQAYPFQRLRRIKQLGFSELIYPGAGHTRFSHSLGVFHIARRLLNIIKIKYKKDESTFANQALLASLVHDLGHGAFSHAFEDIGKTLDLKMAHHETVSETIIRSGEIQNIIDREMGNGTASNVADILRKDGVKKIHHAVVSSQFDADRLDYIQRDRMMTGTHHAGIDFEWLISNLEIGRVPIGVDDQKTGEIDTFVINPKGIMAAEAYVLGLFQLYPTVYLHKTTRGFEKIFSALLLRVFNKLLHGRASEIGLSDTHPLVYFSKNPDSVEAALRIDDTVMWAMILELTRSSDTLISEFSKRLVERDEFKCIDVRMKVQATLNPRDERSSELDEKVNESCIRIKERILDLDCDPVENSIKVLWDEVERVPYKDIDKTRGPLDRINVIDSGGAAVDLKRLSGVVNALGVYKAFRVYVREDDAHTREQVYSIISDEANR